MKRRAGSTARRVVLIATVGLALSGLAQVVMGGNIDPDDKWAWATDAGWLNFAPLCDGCEGVTAYADHLEGYAWGENIGWIRLGTHTTGGSHTYRNTSATTYGVNIDPAGELYGYAWGANVGWIKFDPSDGGVSIDWNSGSFDGYAWGENVGWIRFKNANPAYNVVSTVNSVYLPLVKRFYPPSPPTPTPSPVPPFFVTNGGFETGDFTGWTHGGELPYSVQGDVRHEGTYAALLGEVKDPSVTQPGSAWMVQEVAVPSGSGPHTLSFWYRLVTHDRIGQAFFQMELRDSGGGLLQQLVKLGATGIIPPAWRDYGWREHSFDLSAYQGQTVQLWFETKQAALGRGTWTFVDEVRID